MSLPDLFLDLDYIGFSGMKKAGAIEKRAATRLFAKGEFRLAFQRDAINLRADGPEVNKCYTNPNDLLIA